MSAAILTARKASLQVAAWLGALLVALFFGRMLMYYGPTLTFAFLSIIAIFMVVMARPAYGALILAAGVPIVSGMQRGFPIPALRPSEAIIALVASAMLLATATRADRVPWRTFDWLALLYAVGNLMLGSFDLIARGDPFSFDAIGELLGPFQFILIYRAVMAAVTSEDLRRRAIRLVMFASIPVALLGIAQSLNLGPTRDVVAKLTGIDVSTAYGYQAIPRATGPFPIWHELGGYLFLVILLGLALYLDAGVQGHEPPGARSRPGDRRRGCDRDGDHRSNRGRCRWCAGSRFLDAEAEQAGCWCRYRGDGAGASVQPPPHRPL